MKKVEHTIFKHRIVGEVNETLIKKMVENAEEMLETYSTHIKEHGFPIPIPKELEGKISHKEIGEMVKNIDIETLFTLNDMSTHLYMFKTLKKILKED